MWHRWKKKEEESKTEEKVLGEESMRHCKMLERCTSTDSHSTKQVTQSGRNNTWEDMRLLLCSWVEFLAL